MPALSRSSDIVTMTGLSALGEFRAISLICPQSFCARASMDNQHIPATTGIVFAANNKRENLLFNNFICLLKYLPALAETAGIFRESSANDRPILPRMACPRRVIAINQQ